MTDKRDTNIDIIRIFALFTVFFIHAFLNNGFYEKKINTPIMFIGTYFRQFFMICVPLFLLITGYLYSGRDIEFNKKYVIKLSKIILPYIIVSILTYISLKVFNIMEGRSFLTMIFGFKENGYTWYIEMYIGLYLLIPFINKGYNNLNKEGKNKLIIILWLICFVPGIINVIGDYFQKYWVILWPFAYYIIGMYLKEYTLNIKKSIKFLILFISTFLHFAMAMIFFRDNIFNSLNVYSNIFCMINSVMVFSLLTDVDCDKMSFKTKKKLSLIAEAVLPAYMISYLVDKIIYKILKDEIIRDVQMRIVFIIPTVILTAFISILLGIIISFITNKIISFWKEKCSI